MFIYFLQNIAKYDRNIIQIAPFSPSKIPVLLPPTETKNEKKK